MSGLELVLAADAWQGVETGTEALVDGWLVAEGDSVVENQPLVNVVLVKASHEIVAPAAGMIDKILVRAEETFAQGQVLAVMRTAT